MSKWKIYCIQYQRFSKS